MESLIVVMIVLALVLMNSSKKNKKKNDTPVPNKPREGKTARPNRPQPVRPNAAGAARNVTDRAKKAASGWAKQLYEADADKHLHYDQNSLDYCDSDVPASGGISFRDLPSGADELAYLRKWNANRERLLEKSLESRG
ncbi:MAG: hypothetical protein IJJ25_13795 [Lachnospiraceae bacterium]|nr:hypothetical protein [Lachnospiraceae bacterium]